MIQLFYIKIIYPLLDFRVPLIFAQFRQLVDLL